MLASMFDPDTEVAKDGTWALACLFREPDNVSNCAAFSSPHIVQLIQLAGHKDLALRQAAVRCIGNVSVGENRFGLALIQAGAIAMLEHMLGGMQEETVVEACWILANLAACGKEAVNALIKAGVYRHVALLVKSGQHDLEREAAYLLMSTYSVGDPEQMQRVEGVVPVENLQELLAVPDVMLQRTVLYAVKVLMERTKGTDEELYKGVVQRFEESGGVGKLEYMQVHRNAELYELAVKIMKDHYETEEVGIVHFAHDVLLPDPEKVKSLYDF